MARACHAERYFLKSSNQHELIKLFVRSAQATHTTSKCYFRDCLTSMLSCEPNHLAINLTIKRSCTTHSDLKPNSDHVLYKTRDRRHVSHSFPEYIFFLFGNFLDLPVSASSPPPLPLIQGKKKKTRPPLQDDPNPFLAQALEEKTQE